MFEYGVLRPERATTLDECVPTSWTSRGRGITRARQAKVAVSLGHHWRALCAYVISTQLD
jgi:hypothetical protein